MGRELGHDLGIVAASEGSVQIDEVNPFGSSVLPPLGRGSRVTESLCRASATLNQLHCLPASNVDRRQQYEPVSDRHCL